MIISLVIRYVKLVMFLNDFIIAESVGGGTIPAKASCPEEESTGASGAGAGHCAACRVAIAGGKA